MDKPRRRRSGCGPNRRYSGRHDGPTRGGRILFVEDEESISEPFSRALAREGFEPVVTRTAAGALELADRIEPDLVLLDLTLPDGDGRDVCRELRRSSDVPIVMLTARGTEMDRVVGLELGADDYVVKPFSGAEVISRIRAVLRRARGRRRAGEPVIVVGELEVDAGARRVALAGEELELTRKEFDLLAELARNAGQVVTREDLMARVWDVNWFGSTKTLDVHVGSLRRKLGDDPADPRFIETVRGVGFRFAAPEGRAVSLRRSLLLALAYVLLLAVVALGVPLALSLRDRVDAEVRTQARSQADVRRGQRRASLIEHARPRTLRRLTRDRRDLGARTGDRRRRARGGARRQRRSGRARHRATASRPEIAAALRGHSLPADRATARRSARTSSPPPSRSLAHGAPIGAVRVTQSVDAVNRAVRPVAARARAARPASSSRWALVAGALIARRIARPIRRLDRAADAGRRRASSRPRATIEGSRASSSSLARSFNEMTAPPRPAVAQPAGVRGRCLASAADAARPGCGCNSRSCDSFAPTTTRRERRSTRRCTRSIGSRRSSTSC